MRGKPKRTGKPKGGAKRHISNVKRANQKRNKLVKQGKAKPLNSTPLYIPNQAKRAKLDNQITPWQPSEEEVKERQQAQKRERELAYQELADSISTEDRAFIHQNARKRKWKAESGDGSSEEDSGGDEEDGMEQMEEKALARIQSEKDSDRKIRPMLPIKTKHGLKERNILVSDSEEEEEEEAGTKEDEAAKDKEVEEEQELETPALAGKEVSIVELYAKRKELLAEKKIHIGSLAANFIEAPEDRIINLEKLVKLVDSEQPPHIQASVQRLAAASVLEILKDVTPGYRILHTDQQATNTEKLKKDTLRLHKYETALLRCYKTYLLKLEKLVNLFKSKERIGKDPVKLKQAEYCLECMCQLLVAHPHFNYAANILHAVVPILTSSCDTARAIVRKAIQEVFRGDMRGEISCEAVKLINHLVKSRKHNVRTDVVDVLLSLRIKNVNLDKEKEEEIELKKKEARKKKLLEKSKVSRQEKKRRKKLEQLERELLEARGQEGAKVKEKFFTEATKLVFTIYFRILKSFPRSNLMGSVLEGLAKFAHVINLEFFSDLIAAFQTLLASDFLQHRDTLLVVSTVFTILSGQGEALNIDPASFYVHLYNNLFTINAVRTHNEVPLAVKALSDMLIKRRKKVSKGRVLGFSKRLGTLCLQLLHHGTIAGLALLRQLLVTHTAVEQLLDSEHEVGSGVFDPTVSDPEHACASNTTAWELSLLANHYHHQAARLASHIAAACPTTGVNTLPQELKRPGEELFTEYSMDEMAFVPPVQPPPSRRSGAGASKRPKATTPATINFDLTTLDCAESLDFFSALKNG